MTLLDDIEQHFHTKNLYEVLNIDREANHSQIKKAYRKVSLKVHPDRVGVDEKENATKRFQTLARVHFILSNDERRNLYDSQGIIANEDGLEGEADWNQYWRLLFPKISEKDIRNFMDSYVGSKEEEDDLIRVYNKFKGDIDILSETHIGFDEERTRKQLVDLIHKGKITAFPKFNKDNITKKNRRIKRAERESKEAEKLKAELMQKNGGGMDNITDLTALIQSRSRSNFESMISNLEAKYAPKTTRTNKRKRA